MIWGTGNDTKTDEFLEKFQTAFDPPLIIGKSCCNFFKLHAQKPCLQVQKLQHQFLDWNDVPIPWKLFRKFICFYTATGPQGSIQCQITWKRPFPPICPHRITSGGFFHHSNVNLTTHDVISAIFSFLPISITLSFGWLPLVKVA